MWSHTSIVLCTSIADFVTQNMFLYASFQKIVNALTETHSRNWLSQIHISNSWLSMIKKISTVFLNQSELFHLNTCLLNSSVVSNSLVPTDCSSPGSSVHGISQARILEWVTFPSPGDLYDPEIEPGSPVLRAVSLPLSRQGSPSTSIDGFIFFL